MNAETIAHIEELLDRKAGVRSLLNDNVNLSSDIRAATKALEIAAGHAEGIIGRGGIDLVLQDLDNIAEVTRTSWRDLTADLVAINEEIDSLTAKGHPPIVDSMPRWSLYGTQRVSCRVCGEQVTLSGKWDHVRDRTGLRHYTERGYR